MNAPVSPQTKHRTRLRRQVCWAVYGAALLSTVSPYASAQVVKRLFQQSPKTPYEDTMTTAALTKLAANTKPAAATRRLPPPPPPPPLSLTGQEMVDALHTAFGDHHSRAVHAKGIMAEGTFQPAPEAAGLSNASLFSSGTIFPFLSAFPILPAYPKSRTQSAMPTRAALP